MVLTLLRAQYPIRVYTAGAAVAKAAPNAKSSPTPKSIVKGQVDFSEFTIIKGDFVRGR